MDIKAYIESGILEQYVIGTLSPTEYAEVEKNVLLHEELAKEVESIELALEAYARHSGVKPRLTEDQLIQNLQKLNAQTAQPVITTTPDSSNKLIYVLGILALGLAAFLFFMANKNSKAGQLNQKLQFTLDSLRNQCAQTGFQNDVLIQKLQLLNDPGAKYLKLEGTPLSPQSYASVIIDSTTNKLFFDFAGLPKPPTGKQFQLWVIQDGKPVDMGVVNNDHIGVIANVELNFVARAQAFALTLEDQGGKPSPTMEQMYVIGNVL